MSWNEPRWSRPPPSQYEWSLDEIKGGVVLTTHRISERCTTFGRAADSVSVPTAHQSCSRLHARLAFDSAGVPWLRDLGSGNGTFVNKKRLPAKSCGKVEDGRGEGSRGVIVYPGDMIVFGASTRLFCLVGPEEFGRNALEEKRAKEKAAKAQAKASESALVSKEDENCVSWGIDVAEISGNAHAGAGIGDQSLEPLEAMQIPSRHRKLYDKIMAMKYKIANIRKENERIESKSVVSELTEGQISQLERNREKEETLSTEIDDMEQELRRNISGEDSQHSNSQVPRKRDKEDNFSLEIDTDDFYDRTLSKRRKNESLNKGTETEQTLTAKWKKLISTLNQQKSALKSAQGEVDAIKTKLRSASCDTDEVFFIKNDLDLAKDCLIKTEKDVHDTEKELLDVEKLLGFYENLVFDRSIDFIGSKASFDMLQAHTNDSHKMLPPPAVRQVEKVKVDSTPQLSVDRMPPPNRKVPLGQKPPSHELNGAQSKLSADLSSTQPEAIKMVPLVKRKPLGPMRPQEGTLAEGTLAVLSAAKASLGARRKDQSGVERQVAAPAKKKPSLSSHKPDPSKDEWMEPSGQDGSGFTKLNKKFGGRY